MRKLLIFGLVGAVVVVMLAAGVLVFTNPTSTRGAEHLDYGEAIQIDDFAFAATSSERVSQIGTETANGVFYVVPFKVMNRAKRVSFRFNPEFAQLVDDRDLEYTSSAKAREVWFAAHQQSDGCMGELAAGTECETVLVFDVPADTQAPVLKIKFSGGLFEVMDAVAFGNRVIQLK